MILINTVNAMSSNNLYNIKTIGLFEGENLLLYILIIIFLLLTYILKEQIRIYKNNK